jgi:hypothetical protein
MLGQVIEVIAVLIGIYLVLTIGQGFAAQSVIGSIGSNSMNLIKVLQGSGK